VLSEIEPWPRSLRHAGSLRRFAFVLSVLLSCRMPKNWVVSAKKLGLTCDGFIQFIIHYNALCTMGSRNGAVVRALASHQCGPGSITTRCHMWVEFLVGSRLAPRLFLRFFCFLTFTKSNKFKFQFDQERRSRMKTS